MDIRTAQQRAWANKIDKGFNISDVSLEINLLHKEVSEVFDAWRTDPGNLPDELADVVIFALGLARMTGVDLDAAVEAKLFNNERRTYRRLGNGTLVKNDPCVCDHHGDHDGCDSDCECAS